MEAIAEDKEGVGGRAQPEPARCDAGLRLGTLRRGARGIVAGIAIDPAHGGRHGVSAEELERRLLEIGFVEGARVRVLHEGPIGRDPIVVSLDGMRIALRRREAGAIVVTPSQ